MKKSLFVLPLLALIGGALAGCGDNPNPGPNPGPEPDPKPVISDEKLPPEEAFGHKRVTSIEDGKSYYFGIYKKNSGETYHFLNGNEHSDAKGKYPYYMSETVVDSEDGFAGMATVTAKFVDDTHFTLQITADGKDNDGKYISIYKAQSSFSNQVMSIHCADEIGEKFKDQECYYNFEWLDVYDEYSIETAVISMTDERVGETEDTPKFFGTDDQYVSMDCAHEDKAFMETYNLAYFYEV